MVKYGMISKDMTFKIMASKIMNSKFSTLTIKIIAITLIGKVMGILRDRMQGIYFGTYSAEGIAFTQASLLPRVFLDIVFASVLSASFIPVFNNYLETKGKEAAFELAASFIKIVLLVTIVVTIIAMIFTGPIYFIFMDGGAASPDVRYLGTRLLRMMFPIMAITSLAFSFTGILQSLGQFYIPAAMSIASNGVILLYYFFLIDRFGVFGLAAAFLLGWSMQVVIQIPFLIRHGFFKNLRLYRKPPPTSEKNNNETLKIGLRDIKQLTLPVMVASWLGPVNFFINARASVPLYGGEHGFVAINMAYTLYTVITGLLVLSVANVLFPALSKLVAREDTKEFIGLLRGSMRGLLFFLLPITFGLIAIAEPLVSLVFQGGRFQETSVDITQTALSFFSLGIIGFGMQVILSRACFAMQDGLGPLVTSILAIAVNFILSFTLAPVMEIGGPALASSIAITLAALGLFLRLHKKLPEKLWTLEMTVDTAKMLILSVIMYVTVIFSMDFFSDFYLNFSSNFIIAARFLDVIIPTGIGGLVYLAGAFVFRVGVVKFL